jgi:hypothetical protein
MWKALQQKPWKSTNIIGWGADRDEQIKKCKIILNIHHFECFTAFEHVRCDRLIFADKIIISDECFQQECLDIYPFVLFVKYPEILATVEKVLSNFDNVQEIFESLKKDTIIFQRQKTLENFISSIPLTETS